MSEIRALGPSNAYGKSDEEAQHPDKDVNDDGGDDIHGSCAQGSPRAPQLGLPELDLFELNQRSVEVFGV